MTTDYEKNHAITNVAEKIKINSKCENDQNPELTSHEILDCISQMRENAIATLKLFVEMNLIEEKDNELVITDIGKKVLSPLSDIL